MPSSWQIFIEHKVVPTLSKTLESQYGNESYCISKLKRLFIAVAELRQVPSKSIAGQAGVRAVSKSEGEGQGEFREEDL